MSFRVIAGSGHCGTMWLARVLDTSPDQRWTHELRTTMTGKGWQHLDQYAPHDRIFDAYWQRIQHEAQYYDVVGDSNSWPPEKLPGVHRAVQRIERVIYLMRDKERQLYSIMNHSPVWSLEHRPTICEARLRFYAEISGLSKDERLLVDANDFMPDWLRKAGLTVDVYSLEELTTDISALWELAPWLTEGELRMWQQTDINRKVPA